MDADRLDIDKALQYLTIEEKLRMLSGNGPWHTFGVGELPSVRMSDGPNGLRMTDGISASALPATCFPTPSVLANSFDPALVYSVGAAIGREATAMGVNLLFAPGINIKRTPLGGRNFEYFSEDPLLSGTLGRAFVSGVQSTGVGACVKHFAANNTENYRMYCDAVIDKRALHEIYLKPFELALTAEPAAVMCAYNKLNGEYCSQNAYLLDDVLRKKWHYGGVTVSDYGAVRDRTKALIAGLDLEMPDSYGLFADGLKDAFKRGEITEERIDASLRRILELTDNVYLEPYGDFDADAHDRLSYNAAVDGAVLLKNDNGFLPLTKNMSVLVTGSLAADAPIEGGGSSHVTPLKSIKPLDAFRMRAVDAVYCRGYSDDPKENAALYREALSAAENADAVIVYAGPPAPTEGIDRKTLALPPEQDALITGLANAGRRVCVVLTAPGPVLMPWIGRVRSVVYSGLGGQCGALAAVDILFGRVNPRGRLAETFPIDEADFTSEPNGYSDLRRIYRESIFVGYRYFDAVKRRVLFPFGHGLTFSEIEYGDVHVIRKPNNEFDVTVKLTNLSARDAYEVVQVYVSDRTGRVMCAPKQLAAFSKVFVEGKTSTNATLHIPSSAFEFYNVDKDAFSIPDGEFKIMVGASSADIKKEISVKIDGDYTDRKDVPPSYATPVRTAITDADFEAVYGAPIPPVPAPPHKGEFTTDSCVNDIASTLIGKLVRRTVMRRAKACGKKGSAEYEAFKISALYTPLSAVASMSDGALTTSAVRGIVKAANGKLVEGLKLILKKQKNDNQQI